MSKVINYFFYSFNEDYVKILLYNWSYFTMQKLLLKNIKQLVGIYDIAPKRLQGAEMKQLPAINNAWLAIEDGKFAAWGSMQDFPGISDWKDLEVIDCSGKLVLPSFVDSHTHIVYAGNREQEFVDRINGLTYDEIFAKGGGILNSVERLRKTSEDELYEQSLQRFNEVISLGTGAIEIKSGYGLDTESELRMLRVIRRLRDLNSIPVKATFLGAHAVPLEFKGDREAYLKKLLNEILPAIAAEKIADYMDVFCEKNYFTADETAVLLDAGAKYGLVGRVHAEQMSHSNGIKTAVQHGAISADHVEFCSDEDIELLKGSKTMATILPGAAYFLGLPLPPARKMIDAGLGIAFASDYNPGSCPSGNMMQMMSMACVQYKLNPEEAFNAVTVNTAYAMGLEGKAGMICIGNAANFIITKPISSLGFLSYAFGSSLIDTVLVNGLVKK